MPLSVPGALAILTPVIRVFLSLGLLALTTGCAEPAAVAAVNARLGAAAGQGTAPPLVPLSPLLAAVDNRQGLPPPAGLVARIQRLDARAAALRGPVLSGADRARLSRTIARP